MMLIRRFIEVTLHISINCNISYMKLQYHTI